MTRFLWICLGGAVGTGARYLLSGWTLQALGSSFPYGTLAVNVLGSFLIGIIHHAGSHSSLISPELRVVLAIGVMGGFTTYSSFNYETLQYLETGSYFLGFLNIAVMVLSCLAAGVLGLVAAKALWGS